MGALEGHVFQAPCVVENPLQSNAAGSACPDSPESASGTPLARTPLHDLHRRLGAKMVAFAGYEMPLQYPAGLLREHLHTRASAGLFDVSHMGQITLVPRSGDVADAARALERLLPVDVLGLAPGRQRYGLLTAESGGILDDLMVANLGDHLRIVVNASRKALDLAHLRSRLADICDVRLHPDALIALQGPDAEAALARIAPEVRAMRFMDVRCVELAGMAAVISRSGYTGEDGFEIAVAPERGEELAERLLSDPAVRPIGLGARDSLRLEAGLCLYGNDLDESTSPVEAALGWAIQPVRRKGGEREGGFAGADTILAQLERGAKRRRVGLRAEGRAPVRAGAPLFAREGDAQPVGRVTSGSFGPSVQAPVAMGYVPTVLADPGRRIFAEVRGQRLPLTVVAGPFVAPGYKRS